MRMNVQRNLVTCSWQLGKSWDADRHVVTHAASLNNGLIRMLDQQLPSKVSNHVAHIVAAVRTGTGSINALPDARSCSRAPVHHNGVSGKVLHKENRLNLV